VAVRVDDSLFTGPRMGPGWTQADVTAGFVAPVSAIAVNAGRTSSARYAPRVEDTAIAAADAFGAQLRARGIHTVGEPARALALAQPEVLGEVTSAPLGDVVGYMLAASDNNAAEALARLVARDRGRGTTVADAARAVLDEIGLLGVPTAGATLTDGSGLSDGSRLPATLLADVLALAASEDHPQLRPLLTGLPVAGLTGTLGERFAGKDAGIGLGVVRAKTGSLNGVTSLAGAVRDVDGRLLVFAVLADAVPGTEAARAAVDDVAATLASCGCR
jgi:D-alanyl-D-alanine carboxypeptidase/D-alanyl-D-alanine-endopeptidase (penicillin-binding protein 4)